MGCASVLSTVIFWCRFGDSNLQKCEVMLKDVSDSQRLNTRFYEDEGAVLADEVSNIYLFTYVSTFY